MHSLEPSFQARATQWLSTVRVAIHEAIDDDLLGEGAKIAFYFFLSLFPLVVVIFALTGLVGGDAAFARLFGAAQGTVPQYAWQFVGELLAEITGRERPGLLSFGVVLTLWAASSGIVALTEALNEVYDVAEPRSWWRRRLLAVGVLVSGVALLVLGTATLIPSSDWLRGVGVGRAWSVARWPLGFLMSATSVWLAYRYLPARDQRNSIRETAIGAVVATGLWVAATLLFRFYLANFSAYDRTYGAVGAVIVLLIWLQIAALAVLFGGKLAAVLERPRGASRIRRASHRATRLRLDG